MAPTKKSTPAPAAPVASVAASAASDSQKVTGKKAPSALQVPAPKSATKGPVVNEVPVAPAVPVVLNHTVPSATSSTAVTAPAAPSVVLDAGVATPDNVLTTIIEKVNLLSSNFKEVQLLLKVLSKDYEKQQKIIEKAQKKRQNAKNSPSGFAKPNKISDELCDFIGVPHGTEKSRTDITRFINAYVKEHNLNKPENKRFILPDDKLKKILNVSDKEEINYFILQKLISHHFPPSASKLAAAAAALKA
jgi:hypothetical protein